jgi:serine/threonine protein kinase
MFNRWLRLRKSKITIDFQQILEFASYLPYFSRNKGVLAQIYLRRIDGAVTVIKTICLPDQFENLLNLRHPMIAPLIGCVLPVESSGQREFKTVRLYATESSLADVLLNAPLWWTPTVKAKAVVGIALGLRFAHGLGLLHGAVRASNILFDADRRIQIADFSPTRLETGEVEPFLGEELAPTVDISAFASLLFEIAVGGTGTPPIGAAGARLSMPLFKRLFRG